MKVSSVLTRRLLNGVMSKNTLNACEDGLDSEDSIAGLGADPDSDDERKKPFGKISKFGGMQNLSKQKAVSSVDRINNVSERIKRREESSAPPQKTEWVKSSTLQLHKPGSSEGF